MVESVNSCDKATTMPKISFSWHESNYLKASMGAGIKVTLGNKYTGVNKRCVKAHVDF